MKSEKDMLAASDWDGLIDSKKLRYGVALGNLRKIIESGSPKLSKILNYLAHPRQVRKSGLTPFHILTAYEDLSYLDKSYGSAISASFQKLSQAMDHAALTNVPVLPGITVCSGDNSSSMNQNVVERRKLRLIDISAMFQAIAFKRNSTDMIMTVFAHKLAIAPPVEKVGILTLAKSLVRVDVGEGTNAHLIFDWLRQAQKVVDRIIILTDSHYSLSPVMMETMHDQQRFSQAILRYRREINPDVWLHLLNLSPIDKFNSRHDKHLRYNYVSGFHEDMFDQILKIEQEAKPIEHLKLQE